MARDITSGFQTEIEAAELKPAIFIKAEFDSGDVNLWSGIGDKVFNGDTYLGGGQLIEVSTVQESQKLQANGVQFTLSGIPSAFVSLALTAEYQWRPISMWFAVLDTDDSIIADPYLIFKGKMDVMEISDDGEFAGITVFSENDLIILTKNKERRYTPEDQKNQYGGDLGLDFVPLIADVEILWGTSQSA